MEPKKVALVALFSSGVALAAGYAVGRASVPDRPGDARRTGARELAWPGSEDEPAREIDDATLRACEASLASAEDALARRPPAAAAVDVATLPDEVRAALATPQAVAAVEAEVERRVMERFERERERRRAEWATRRAEARERLRAIGIDDETLARVTPTMCAMRDVYRQAWQSDRGGGGGAADGGVRMGRQELRDATAGMRAEVEASLGSALTERLGEEGGMRALGSAVECGDDGPMGRRAR